MVEALGLTGGEKVLEVGAGSGYAAAVLAEIAGEVYTIERIGQLAQKAGAALSEIGCENAHVIHADGTLGWPEQAPYDAIVVAAGGPDVPESLKYQLKTGWPPGDTGGYQCPGPGTGKGNPQIRDRVHHRGPGRCSFRTANWRGRLDGGRRTGPAADGGDRKTAAGRTSPCRR